MELEQILDERTIKDMDYLMTRAKGRKYMINAISIDHADNWQCVGTPYDIAGEMLDLFPKDTENYIVFFALEFLELLVKERGFDADKILFVADNQIESDFANFYGCNAVVLDKSTTINKENINGIINGANMKFGTLAVVGNPPYQTPVGDSIGTKPLYHLFVESVIDGLNPDYFSFIIPSRWMIGGKGLDKHRERMMNDRRMKKIVHFGGSKEVFVSVEIKGGVNYFLWEKNHDGECEFCHGNTFSKRFLNTHDVILQDNNAFGILDKVMNKTSNWISEKCLSSRPFGLRSAFSDWNETGVKCYSAKKKINFCNSDAFTDKSNVLSKWKVVTSKGINPNKEGRFEVYNNLFVIEPNTICTETYLVVNTFETENEANHFLLYMKSRFFRFMVSLRVLTQNMCMDSFNWVPDMLDYSTVWTDKELYEEFKLTRQEQKHIESKIKAI